MGKWAHRSIVILSTVCFLVLVSSSVCIAQELASNKAIKIGVVFGLTGAAHVWSEYGRKGLELARNEINAAGGIKGKKLELVFEDSRTIPAESVSAYRKLITADKVKVVIGNVWAFITNPMIPIAGKDHILLVSPLAMPESIETTNDYFFSMGERIVSVRDAVDLFFKKNPDIKKIGIFCWDDTWGQSYLKIWKEVAEQNGASVELAMCTSDFSNDFRTDVAKIAARKVDTVIITHYGDIILGRMREQGFSARVLGTSNLIEDIKATKAPKELFEGVYITDWRPSDDFIKRFKTTFNTEPIVEAHNSYETLHSIAKALASDDPDLVAALRKVKYQGVAGEIDFSRGPFANYSTAKLFRVQNGELELVHN